MNGAAAKSQSFPPARRREGHKEITQCSPMASAFQFQQQKKKKEKKPFCFCQFRDEIILILECNR